MIPFTRAPQHILHPVDGWLSKEKARELIPDLPDDFAGGEPRQNWPHHIEFEIGSGLEAHTPLTADELAADQQRGVELARAQAEREQASERRLEVLRERAEEDPVFAALLEHLGIK